MSLFRDKYRIESARLKHWDYASGWYFVTICTRGMECFFGEVRQGEMDLSPIGEIALTEWQKSAVIRSNVILDEFVIMPNHMHGIVVFEVMQGNAAGSGGNRFGPLRTGSLQSLANGYKGAVTRWCQNSGYGGVFAWQPRFYDHIIRSAVDLERIRTYIRNNPLRWELDKNNPAGMWA